jgi:cell division protein FtsQ
MNIKANIRKVGSIALWCAGGIAALALLVAAINEKNSRTCQGLDIEINGGGRSLFVDKKEIARLLVAHGCDKLPQKRMASFDLQSLESLIRSNAWVKEAQLFFDNNEILKVRITERTPVARILTASGGSFYIDSSGAQLTMSERVPLRLPLFTGFPADRFARHGRDSSLSEQVRQLGNYIGRDPFWSRAIEQVNITAGNNFEMVPLIGDHIIEFGDGTDYRNKFHRLLLFYRKVMTLTGFDSYARVKVAYAGQVIGTRKEGFVSKADSLQAIRNVLALIQAAQKLEADTARQREVKPLEQGTMTEQMLKGYDLPDDSESIQPPRQGVADGHEPPVKNQNQKANKSNLKTTKNN